MSIWTALISPVTSVVKTAVEGKQRRDEMKAAKHLKEIEYVNNLSVEEIKTQREKQKSLKDTFKDEYVLGLISIPTIMAFLGPDYAAQVNAGFAALSTTPDWYQWLLVAIFSAASGIPLSNKVVDVVNKIKGK